MPRGKKKGASGAGSIRKKIVTRNGNNISIGKPVTPRATIPAPASKSKEQLPERVRRRLLKSLGA